MSGDEYETLEAALNRLSFVEVALASMETIYFEQAYSGLLGILRDAHDTIRATLGILAEYQKS